MHSGILYPKYFSMTSNKTKKRVWQYPWRYKEGFLIALGIVIVGFLIELFTAGGIEVPSWPVNLIIGVVFINLLTLVYITAYKHPVVRWLASPPAAIAAVAVVTFMTFLMGFIPQNSNQVSELAANLGLTHVAKSWTFALAQIYFLTVLGMASLKRTSPLTGRNIGFLLNHVGLWIVIAAASLGTGDLKRLNMQLQEGGNFSNTAVSDNNQQYELRVAMKLHDFQMEVYNPKLAVIDENYNLVRKEGLKMPMVKKGLVTPVFDWNVEILEFFELGVPNGEGSYKESKMFGAAPVAKVRAVHTPTKRVKTGWITNGSFMVDPSLVKLSNYAIVLTQPEPKKYASVVEYVTKDGKRDTARIEVNDPLKLNGWKIYQLSYNSARGRWSKTSVLELVNDPWLPVVYTGIFMMMAGAVYIFWRGRSA